MTEHYWTLNGKVSCASVKLTTTNGQYMNQKLTD